MLAADRSSSSAARTARSSPTCAARRETILIVVNLSRREPAELDMSHSPVVPIEMNGLTSSRGSANRVFLTLGPYAS